jgi:hypothetical protein
MRGNLPGSDVQTVNVRIAEGHGGLRIAAEIPSLEPQVPPPQADLCRAGSM